MNRGMQLTLIGLGSLALIAFAIAMLIVSFR
jgi:hypothetical protein